MDRENRLLVDYIRSTEMGTVKQLTTDTYAATVLITGDARPDAKIHKVGVTGGPDRVRNIWWKILSAACDALCSETERMLLGMAEIPGELTIGRTVLIFKKVIRAMPLITGLSLV